MPPACWQITCMLPLCLCQIMCIPPCMFQIRCMVPVLGATKMDQVSQKIQGLYPSDFWARGGRIRPELLHFPLLRKRRPRPFIFLDFLAGIFEIVDRFPSSIM